ncbi:hypothetical protein C7S20_03330 [Christiangramia fulva]|uniref:Uncharacterized protein n=1 Tax=Christiangramia fulva TaxID=2126553 RepID=A0A2R3Z292_9FLAO|nr:nitrous oxide reductase accessory protein NosL [Christiangramia fulva]AVR44365.1 hypothetical protein C7S20_03330 [Christiangramia fulva]
MKKIIFILAFLILPVSLMTSQTEGSKFCAFCKMPLKQNEFFSEISISKSEKIHFGSIECLLNYLIENEDLNYQKLSVTNYLHPEIPIPAKEAIYIKSNRIQSPMGAHLAAFSSKEEIKTFGIKENDKVYSWEELYQSFKTKNNGSEKVHFHDHFRPDAFAPNGVMGDHLHPKGEWMLSARYMYMEMDGMKTGNDKITSPEVFENYSMAPASMEMQMLMLGVMYAPSSRLTLALMQNIVRNDMTMNAQMMNNGMSMMTDFSTMAEGFGDLQISALYGLYSKNARSLHLNLGLNVPVGSINERDDTPMTSNAKLAYAMQPGQGTFNAIAGFTYKEMYDTTSWGSQFLASLPLGENSEAYHWGALYQLNFWGAYRVSTNISFSGRVLGLVQNGIDGEDEELNAMMSPATNPQNYGGEKVKAFGGMNISFPVESTLRSWRVAMEIGAPVYENYNGVQMNENLTFSAGIKYLIF